jgi:hypothetical protein
VRGAGVQETLLRRLLQRAEARRGRLRALFVHQLRRAVRRQTPMNHEAHGPLALPAAALLAAAGAGSGGLGTWLLLAAQAARHPAVQQSAQVSGHYVAAGAQALLTHGSPSQPQLLWAVIGTCVGVGACGMLFLACICGGGIAWSIRASPDGAQQLQDWAALAQQIHAGGRQASTTAARALNADTEDVDRWVADWRRAAEGPRSRSGRNGQRQHGGHQ